MTDRMLSRTTPRVSAEEYQAHVDHGYCPGCGKPVLGVLDPCTEEIVHPEFAAQPKGAAKRCRQCAAPIGDFDVTTGERLASLPFESVPDDVCGIGAGS